jgi:DNA-binding NarL/FixJ family response regulator
MQTIIVADDQEMYRMGVVELLSGNEEFQIVAQSSDWKSLLAVLAVNKGALIITSATLVADLRRLIARATLVYCRVLLVTEDSDALPAYTSRGLAGTIQRSASPDTLIETLRRMQAGTAGRCRTWVSAGRGQRSSSHASRALPNS